MAGGIRFDLASGKRIARSVRKTEADRTEVFGGRRVPGQILGTGAVHWGTLDAALLHTDTTGVTVTLDVGGSIDNVLPSKTQSDTIPISSAVLIELIDSDWYVTLAPC